MGELEDALAIHGSRGVSQQSLLDELVELGAPPRSQSSMSRYLNGRMPIPNDFRPAMIKYVRRHRQVLVGAAEATDGGARVVPIRGRRNPEASSDSAADAQEVRRVVMARVLSGPPLSKWDYKVLTQFFGPDEIESTGDPDSAPGT